MDGVEPTFCALVLKTIKYYKLSFGLLKLSNYSWSYQPTRGKHFVTCVNIDTREKRISRSLVIWICVFIGYLDSCIAWSGNKKNYTFLQQFTFLFTAFWDMKIVNCITFCLNQAPTNNGAINEISKTTTTLAYTLNSDRNPKETTDGW